MGTSAPLPVRDLAPHLEAGGRSTEARSRPQPPRSSSDLAEAVKASLMRWPAWPRIAALLAERPETQLFLAGGAVRDALRGTKTPPKDLDFFLEERDLEPVAERLGREGRLERTIFGSPRWFPAADQEMYCDLMAIQRFHNGLGRCSGIVQVLEQVDFTANAMALDLRRGIFFDPVGGADDLRRRIMRVTRFDVPDEPVVPGHDFTRTQWLWLRLIHYTAHARARDRAEDAWPGFTGSAPRCTSASRFEEVFQRLHPRLDEVLQRYGLG